MAREMLLVDPVMLETLQADTRPPPTSQHIKNRVIQETDNDINTILTSKMDPSEQVQQYNQALQKREQYADMTPARFFQQQLSTRMNPEDQSDQESYKQKPDPMEEEIIESVPKTMKSKAVRLVKKMKQGGVLGWNAQGNLTYKGEAVRNTNVVDLVNDVLRKRKDFLPGGWQMFAQGMQETNVPLDLVGNVERYNRHELNTQSTPLKKVQNIDEFHTPSSRLSNSRPGQGSRKKTKKRNIGHTLSDTWLAKAN